ncbi:hypothetical protein [Thermocoleostomius sinensis]|uniref:Uncharacterized protein n=1 Tax=Thermocoleostomius sinensis A174 TaxID=2016057 RepID=A0A9E8ZBS7_9CYAN|nr:hypothetical protein [Thermocoleostomius sinensis]WAL58365.1 hypothetical protein OXH18_14360 [Thermocoleostomius sinensis A174]
MGTLKRTATGSALEQSVLIKVIDQSLKDVDERSIGGSATSRIV